MKKKLSASSQPVKPLRTNSAVITKDVTLEQLTAAPEYKASLERMRNSPKRGNPDTSETPEWTEEQFARAFRSSPLKRKELLSVRLDPDIVEWLKSFGPGHITRINSILREVKETMQKRSTG